jgi:hypothetical protein
MKIHTAKKHTFLDKKNITQTKRPLDKIHGNIIDENNSGWKVVHIYGEPYERGFAHGYLLHKEISKSIKTLVFLCKESVGVSFSKYLKTSNRIMKPILKKHYPEYYEEIRGISAGARRKGADVRVDVLIAWNSYMSLYSYFNDGSAIKCSAFIASGSATKHGDMIMGHNTHTCFMDGRLQNIVLYVTPSAGKQFVMQTSPGYIASVTDWFLCSTGIIGCETTIGDISYKPKFGYPFYCRIRKAMQYGESLDQYDKIMSDHNAGDYACSWLFGDINTNEIMLFELGLKQKNVKRTKNGFYFGMNSAIDDKLRTKETTDEEHDDITTSVGARKERFEELLGKKYKNRIDIENGKEILADHYDVFLRRDAMNSRGICKHMELDPEHCSYPHYPFGCTDGKVVNSKMASGLSFWGRFGSACGRKFDVKKYIQENPKYKTYEPFLDDIPNNKWTSIQL